MKQETKLCPFCGEAIKKIAIKCKHCGSMLNQTSPETPVTPLPSDPTTWVRHALANRYEILEEIGRGGMALVYKAIQNNLNRPVALKVLPLPFTHDPEFLERFHREAAAAAQLNHPNIVTIYDEGVENGVHFIAMEYVDGDNMHHLIRQQGTLSPEATKRLLIPIAEGLGYAHELGMIHRDIKSSNILIDRKSRPVLTDFGIARAAEKSQLTRTGTVLGTPEYMSPEQAKGEATDDRSDIYSLGVVLYECLTGQLPFQSSRILGTIHQITHDPPTPLRQVKTDIPEELENAVLRCLAKKPEERYQSCTELINALEHGETRQVSEAKPVAVPAEQPARPKATPSAPTPDMPLWWKVAVGLISVVFVVVIGVVIGKLKSTQTSDAGGLAPIEQPQTATIYTFQDTMVVISDTIINDDKPPVVSTPRDEIELFLKRGKSYFSADKLTSPAGENALEMADAILSRDKNNVDAHRLKKEIAEKYSQWADQQKQNQQYEKAIEYYKESLKIADSAEVEKKLSELKDSIEKQKEHASNYERLGDEQAQKGQYDQAIEYYKKSLEIISSAEILRKIAAAENERLKEENEKFLSSLPKLITVKGVDLILVVGGVARLSETGDLIKISHFYIGKNEISNYQYAKFLNEYGKERDEHGNLMIIEHEWGLKKIKSLWQPEPGYENHPVVNVTWYGSVQFAKWLNCRLPTEAEWQYAAQGGNSSKGFTYSGSNIADDVSWYDDNSGRKTHPVGTKNPNELNIYDMSGNVWEWCFDLFISVDKKINANKITTENAKGNQRVVRGGSWSNSAHYLECGVRLSEPPLAASSVLGFRVCREVN